MSGPNHDDVLRRLARFSRDDCPEDAALLAYIDAAEAADHVLNAHLAGCPRCINRLVDLRLLVADDVAVQTPPSLIARVQRSVERHLDPAPVPRRRHWRLKWSWPAWGGGVAVAAAMALTVLLLVRGTAPAPEHDLTPRGVLPADVAQAVENALLDDGVRVLCGTQACALRVRDEWLDVRLLEEGISALTIAPQPEAGQMLHLLSSNGLQVALPLPAVRTASWTSAGGSQRQATMALLQLESTPGTVAVDGAGRLVGVVLFGERLEGASASYLLVQPELEKIVAEAGKNAAAGASPGWRRDAPQPKSGDDK